MATKLSNKSTQRELEFRRVLREIYKETIRLQKDGHSPFVFVNYARRNYRMAYEMRK